jgi:hypothetical protein
MFDHASCSAVSTARAADVEIVGVEGAAGAERVEVGVDRLVVDVELDVVDAAALGAVVVDRRGHHLDA